jgi:DNA-binding SARP family transcriptional activator
VKIEFSLLGPLAVAVDDVDLPLDSVMARAVLAVLLLAGSRFVTLSALTDALWAAPPKSAIANLRTYISRLRIILDASCARAAQRLTTHADGGGYRLAVAAQEFDVPIVDNLIQQGRAHAHDGDYLAAIVNLRAALDRWRGPAGQDITARISGTLVEQLSALDEQHQVAQEDLLGMRIALGETNQLLPHARALNLQQPLRERPWEHLIRVLYLSGDPAGALATFQRARTTFGSALGIVPSQRLDDLHRAVLQRDDTYIRLGRRSP